MNPATSQLWKGKQLRQGGNAIKPGRFHRQTGRVLGKRKLGHVLTNHQAPFPTSMGAASSSALRHLSVSALGSQSQTRGPHLLLVSPWHAPHADKVPRAFSGAELSTPIARGSARPRWHRRAKSRGQAGPCAWSSCLPAGAGGLGASARPQGPQLWPHGLELQEADPVGAERRPSPDAGWLMCPEYGLRFFHSHPIVVKPDS